MKNVIKKTLLLTLFTCLICVLVGCEGLNSQLFGPNRIETILRESYELSVTIEMRYVDFKIDNDAITDIKRHFQDSIDISQEEIKALPEYDVAMQKISKFAHYQDRVIYFCRNNDTDGLMLVYALERSVLKSIKNPNGDGFIRAKHSDYVYVLGYEEGSDPKYKDGLYLRNEMTKNILEKHYDLDVIDIEMQSTFDFNERINTIDNIKSEIGLTAKDIQALPKYAEALDKLLKWKSDGSINWKSDESVIGLFKVDLETGESLYAFTIIGATRSSIKEDNKVLYARDLTEKDYMYVVGYENVEEVVE